MSTLASAQQEGSPTISDDGGASEETLAAGETGEDAYDEDAFDDDDDFSYGAAAEVRRDPPPEGATSRVSRRELDERQPGSAPDALRWEPGIAVQQTSHGQASPYVRGLTGQQVLHLFDGVRLNHALYRQGPNQYFFSVDERTLATLEVERGSASVREGSDAIGGVLRATPRRAPLGSDGLTFLPRLYLRYGSADTELGGRAELGVGLGRSTGILLGAGYRDVGLLTSGGVVRHPNPSGESGRGEIAPWVPRFAEEADSPSDLDSWFTQLGTGFREATFDARIDHRFADLEASAAIYGYRQMDAPRTDQCPPPEAPLSECLSIERQFRTLAFATLRGNAGPLKNLELVAAYQRHDESRVRDRPRSSVALRWTDSVDALQVRFRASTSSFSIGAADDQGQSPAGLVLSYGADASSDTVSSSASQEFTDIGASFELSRGQYLDHSRYVSLGAFALAELSAFDWLVISSGARVAFVGAEAPGDSSSGSPAIDRAFFAVVARAGAEARISDSWRLALNIDQGFRAPNLDDLTARQQVGPGFQFENADLAPEQSLTTEFGIRGASDWLALEAWAFATVIENGIQRAVRDSEACPPQTPDCLASRDAFQLVNASEASLLVGGEAGATFFLPHDLSIRTTLSLTWGEGPNLADRGTTDEARVPLSRIPPPHGTLEIRYRHRPTGLALSAGLQWATAQTRLAISDNSDPRIPFGGTPGYATLEVRGVWKIQPWLQIGIVGTNLTDTAYRVHGSSVLGAGRSVKLWMRLGS